MQAKRAGQRAYHTLSIYGSNPNYAFELTRQTEEAPWVVAQVIDLKREKVPSTMEQYFERYQRDINWLVKLRSDYLLDLIRKPEFRVVGCRTTPQAGEELLEVSFDYPHEVLEAGNPVQGGTLVLDPQRFWCLRSYQVRTQGKGSRGTMKFRVLELGEAGEGLPFPRRAVADYEFVSDEGHTNTHHWQFDYDLRAPQQLPGDEEFTLSAFGLPEPPGVEWKKPTPWWLWVGGAGIACLVLGGLFYWLKARAARA